MKKWQESRNYRRIKDETGAVTACIITVDGVDVEVTEEVYEAYARMDRRERYLAEDMPAGRMLSLEQMAEDSVQPDYVGAETSPSADKTGNAFSGQGRAEHLPRRFRQLVGLVYDTGRAFKQDGLFPLAAMDEVCQQEVVVADLYCVVSVLAGVQKAPVPASIQLAIAVPGDADPFTVITTQPGELVQIQHTFGALERTDSIWVLVALFHLFQPAVQSGVTGVMRLALSHNSTHRAVNQAG